MIEIRNLSASYSKTSVLENLNLSVKDGTIHGLVGLNGSGKTTLLNILYGMKKADVGEIECNKSTKKRRKEIAYLETENYFYPRITGSEYLRLLGVENPKFDYLAWNKVFDLPLDQWVEKYSTGMKKKLAFIGILLPDRPILMLDEPFNGIDMETVQKIKTILLKLKESGKTIFITSHILESITGICDSISYLNSGAIEFTLTREEFSSLESRIFSLHQEGLDKELELLIGK